MPRTREKSEGKVGDTVGLDFVIFQVVRIP